MSVASPRLALGVGATALALVLLRAGSFVSIGTPKGEHAWVRLSWSARPERIEQCRRRSDAELAALPEHMRLRLECTGTFARYFLQLTVDDIVVQADTVRGGGFRHDRPMHVLDETSVDSGTRHIVVTLARLDSTAVTTPELKSSPEDVSTNQGREARERDERLRRTEESIAPRLSLDTTVTFERGQVLLITYDGVRRVLEARTRSE